VGLADGDLDGLSVTGFVVGSPVGALLELENGDLVGLSVTGFAVGKDGNADGSGDLSGVTTPIRTNSRTAGDRSYQE